MKSISQSSSSLNKKNKKRKSTSSFNSIVNGSDTDTSQENSQNKGNDFNKIIKAEKQLIEENEEVTEHIQQFKRKLVQHIENRILNAQKRFEEQIHEELEQFEESVNESLKNLRDDHFWIHKQGIKGVGRKGYMEKQFRYKPSLLSEMFKQSNYKTLYHMIVASLFALMINLWTQDYVHRGQVFDMETFLWCFQNLEQTSKVWLLMSGYSYLVIGLVIGVKRNGWNAMVYIPLVIVNLMIQLTIPAYFSLILELGFGTKMILLCEGVRLTMKNYSYFRNKMLYGLENKSLSHYIPPSMSSKGLKSEDMKFPEISIGSFQQEIRRYTYFMLAPTLIYRDQYVKAPHRSISRVVIEFMNFFLSVYYGFVLFKTFCKDPILELRDDVQTHKFVLVLFKLMMPSTFALILLFFGLLHSWLNGWAELLRFPDRTFYLDWWTSSEFGQYYRKWNIVVHEFLYYYVYLDAQKLSRGRIGKAISQTITFLVSAVIHEIIITFALGFFFPICFLLFTGPGILLIRAGSNKIWKSSWINIIFWMLMYIGTSLMITLYLTEYYVRQRITDEFIIQRWGHIIQFIIPRCIYLVI